MASASAPTPGVTQLRSELKYLVPGAEADAIQAAIERHVRPRLFDGRGPDWQVTTVYCDLPERPLLRAAAQVPERNTKVRVRTYLPADGKGGFTVRRCYVEVKLRNRQLSRKSRLACDPAEVAPLLRAGHVPDGLDDDARRALDELRKIAGDRPIEPVLMARYLRRSYPDAPAAFRANLDRCLRISGCADVAGADAEWWRTMPEGTLLHEEPRVVVEVKATGAEPAWLRESLGGAAPVVFSKVQLALGKLFPDLAAPGAAVPE